MRLPDLVELTSLLAANGDLFIENVPRVSAEAIEDYWTASRCRVERWRCDFHRAHDLLPQVAGHDRDNLLSLIEGVVVDVLATELLARIWSALAIGWESHRNGDDVTPVVRSAFLAHLESRNQILHFMAGSQNRPERAIERWNRLRRSAERTTDILLAGLPITSGSAGAFAHDVKRYRAAHDSWQAQEFDSTTRRGIGLVAGAFISQLEQQFPTVRGSVDLNGRIAASILRCLQAEMFQAIGQIQSLWQLRLYSSVSVVELMLSEATASTEMTGC